ncbi:FecR protein [Sedimentisphaera cyanobacteriorum]|uniref:FecR protein n=1 Tax=Sedimentisphaera cyanobacteriorum TaxID=1940790 RepID=A0A1Q2HNA2_9BACT|nr:FecR domain-containing protein [Sedimentisphaera cyanobacteriorum]AQQ08957.1 FecR protein [Sedimentisphaera cyanobacteriorum]
MDKISRQDFVNILMKALDAEASNEDIYKLNKAMRDDQACRRLYIETLLLYVELSPYGSVEIEKNNNKVDPLLAGSVLNRDECSCDIISFPKRKNEKAGKDTIENEIPAARRRPFSKITFALFALTSAALIFLIVYANFFTPKLIETATLNKSIDAKWSGANLNEGSRLYAQRETITLRGGIAEFETNNQTKVIIEGPAEFRFRGPSEVTLEYGQLYSIVEEEGFGFTVTTPNSKIVDLGTEFGVIAGKDGNTELHVIKGKTKLLSDNSWINNTVMEVTENTACRVSNNSSSVSKIALKEDFFARYINKENRVVWRGEKQLDLADIVGGGNGLGTGKYLSGINTKSGVYASNMIKFSSIYENDSSYREVRGLDFIDGVFVPDKTEKAGIVSSQRHRFDKFTDTIGKYWIGIINGAVHPELANVKQHTLTLKGKSLDYPQNKAIFIHPNQGITFDLEKIRKAYEKQNIIRFSSSFGLSDSIFKPVNFKDNRNNSTSFQEGFPRCNFQVLVDGVLKHEKTRQTPMDEPDNFEIPISKEDSFLTVIVSSPVDDQIENAGLLWAVLAEPSLILSSDKGV